MIIWRENADGHHDRIDLTFTKDERLTHRQRSILMQVALYGAQSNAALQTFKEKKSTINDCIKDLVQMGYVKRKGHSIEPTVKLITQRPLYRSKTEERPICRSNSKKLNESKTTAMSVDTGESLLFSSTVLEELVTENKHTELVGDGVTTNSHTGNYRKEKNIKKRKADGTKLKLREINALSTDDKSQLFPEIFSRVADITETIKLLKLKIYILEQSNLEGIDHEAMGYLLEWFKYKRDIRSPIKTKHGFNNITDGIRIHGNDVARQMIKKSMQNEWSGVHWPKVPDMKPYRRMKVGSPEFYALKPKYMFWVVWFTDKRLKNYAVTDRDMSLIPSMLLEIEQLIMAELIHHGKKELTTKMMASAISRMYNEYKNDEWRKENGVVLSVRGFRNNVRTLFEKIKIK